MQQPDISMCSLVSQAANEDPGGTAAAISCYVFLEVALPWKSDVVLSAHFPEGLGADLNRLAAQGYKFKTLAYTSDTFHSPLGFCRVMFYNKPSSSFARFDKLEYVVPTEDIGGLIQAVLASVYPAVPAVGQDPQLERTLHDFERYAAYEGPNVRDMFVCTHGSHDACCGKFGYAAYHELDQLHAARSDGKLRAWRVSHIGGHRLAPTLIDFPEGRYWGHLTSEVIQAIVGRQGPTDVLKPYIRGWGGLTSPEQLVEREIMALEGWSWTTYERSGVSHPQSDGTVKVRIDYNSSDQTVSGTYAAVVREMASVEISGCEYEAPRAYPQYEVTDFHKI